MPEFVSAFCQAVEQSKGLHYALGDVVDDPFREQPAFVNAWLFGPHGEFTTYAKPAVLKENYDFNCRHFDVGEPALWTSTNRYLAGINFLVTLLSRAASLSTSEAGDPGDGRARPKARSASCGS
jgi:hypothetical protein